MKCRCGKVHVRKSASEAVITCRECGWHHTYRALPQRVFTLMDTLATILCVFREDFGGGCNEEEKTDG